MKTLLAILAGVVAVSLVVGCGHEEHPTVAFAMTRSAAGESVHVLARKVDASMPILVGVDGADVTITYSERGLDGVTLHVDPSTFQVRAREPYRFQPVASRRKQRCLELATMYREPIVGADVVGVPHVVKRPDGAGVVTFFAAEEEGIVLTVTGIR